MSAGMDITVLVVEDENDVVDLLRYHLKRAGYKVLIEKTGDAGLDAARRNRPDAAIFDVMMPGMTGLEVCRALKGDPDTADIPVLMLTAKSEVKDRVKGLEIGADDYVTKPFSPKEVVLRVQGMIRRAQTVAAEATMVELDGITLDRTTLHAQIDGVRVDLTTTEFKLLSALVGNRGRTMSRDVLLRDVWGYTTTLDTRTVDTHMRRLREKIGRHAARLETIRGEGYRFNAVPVD
jgi:two-component system phosphate regulon response regulator PhoB